MAFSLKHFCCYTLFLLCCSCGGFNYKLIHKTDRSKIYYIDSKKIGKRVKAELLMGNKKTEYNIYLGYEGLPLHIIRFLDNASNYQKDNLEFFRLQEFLVTDTTKSNNPNYLGNEVNGYYHDPSIYNRLNELPKVISPISKEELILFREIENVLQKQEVKFQPIDSNKVLGWFKYTF